MFSLFRRMFPLLLVPMVIGTLGGVWSPTEAAQSDSTTRSAYLPSVDRKPAAQPSQRTTIYLPLVINQAPQSTIFGMQATPLATYNTELAPLNIGWMRLVGPLWSEVQPVEGGAFNWDVPSVRNIETTITQLRRDGIYAEVILISIGSPSWATVNNTNCGAIKPEYYDDYARFMEEVVRRFTTVQYWEIGNEPDIDYESARLNPDSGFGCWGDENDEYYGGRAYGEMLKVVYPAIKQTNPKVQVLNGGLLLNRPYDANDDARTRSARFIEGVLTAGAGSSFDIMNYHFYTYFTPQTPTPDGESTVGNGAVDWKARYLRDMLQRYGVTEKPLMNSEVALLCYVGTERLGECREAQANGVGRMYARAARDRLLAGIWYTFATDSFNYTGFIDPRTRERRPVYEAYRYANAMFGGATFLGSLEGQQEGVEGYRFKNGGRLVTIVWSDQADRTASVPVPAGSTPSCTDRDGTLIACQNNGGTVTLPVSSEPRYVRVP